MARAGPSTASAVSNSRASADPILRRNPLNPSPPLPSRLTIIGLGNTMAADDGLGPWVIRHMETAALPPGTEVRWVPAPGPELLTDLEQEGEVVFIDAARVEGQPAGTLLEQLIPPGSDARLEHARSLVSTHGLSLAELLKLARVLGRARAHVRLIGVVGERFEPGEGLSPSVEIAAARVVDRLLERIAAFAPDPLPRP